MVLGFFLSATVVHMSSEDVVNAPAFPLPAALLRAIYDGTIGQSPAWDTPELRDWYLDTNYAAPVPLDVLGRVNDASGFPLNDASRLTIPGQGNCFSVPPNYFRRTPKNSGVDRIALEAVLYRIYCTSGSFDPSSFNDFDWRVSSTDLFLIEASWGAGGYVSPARYLVLWAFVEALHASIRYGRGRYFDLVQAVNCVLRFGQFSFWPPAMQCYEALAARVALAA